MKLRATIKNGIIEIICLLYILLFVYAAVSKLLDFENFQVQLGQSPLLSAFAGWASWGVVIVELIISILLSFPKWRLFGLYAAFSLMTMFTTYIIIILNFSPFVPCSCGGILEDLGWTEHLVFNIGFIFLALIGIILATSKTKVASVKKRYRHLILSSFLFGCSTIIVSVLFLFSETIIHHRNTFIRRFPPYPATEIQQLDLKFNSYYFAGISKKRIYLGNYTTPFQITEFDTLLKFEKRHTIDLDKVDFTFRSVETRVLDSSFYLFDGVVPCLYIGNTANWQAKLQAPLGIRFTQAEPINTKSIVFRAFAPENGENILGLFELEKRNKMHLKPGLLQKQIDGVFGTDGMLKYDPVTKKVVYLYKYRNQFMVVNESLNEVRRGKTIDTFSRAKIQVKYLTKSKERKMTAPPFIVNKTMTVYDNLLFVASALPGKYEAIELWETATIIDVYDLANNSYLFSFPIYNIGKEKMKSFNIHNKKLYAILGTHLVVYQLNHLFKSSSNK
ncbi:hypothetical protein FFWV33_15600 [Flavobacterium faecale]|uniref:Methylamine utilisation protein MauE domain-containing protein n=1 Tax=Flavobacterium faecale TaxID=1355330 RepID=A0A2S1LGE5_9FLAO|nr:DoxX family protein [Flavobacterium faecale]AWG22850.1 hypothetical protein FFWV33_15600 [Flavobacterium faecale]